MVLMVYLLISLYRLIHGLIRSKRNMRTMRTMGIVLMVYLLIALYRLIHGLIRAKRTMRTMRTMQIITFAERIHIYDIAMDTLSILLSVRGKDAFLRGEHTL